MTTIDGAKVRVRYDESTSSDGRIRLSTDGVRSEGRLRAKVRMPMLVRDGLLTVGDVLASDLRRKAQDRSDYLAYVLAKGGKVTQALWDAQKAYLARTYGEAAREESPLDPLVTIRKDAISLEAFSRDESAYIRLELSMPGSLEAEDHTLGTSTFDLGSKLLKELARVRSYRETFLEVTPSSGGTEKELIVPYRWLRAFSQVQAASTLGATTFELAPIDLYNVLLFLRQHKAKKPPRGLRFELVPGEYPRLVLEPWDAVITTTRAKFDGPKPLVVKAFGRNRLTLLSRILPHARSIRVFTMGAGLPLSLVVDAGDARVVLSLSGWTDSGWAGIATFDLLTPGSQDDLLMERVSRALQSAPEGMTLEQLTTELGRQKNEIRAAVLSEIQRGRALFDLATGRFRGRSLTLTPFPAEKLKYRDETEERAHRLLEPGDRVRVAKTHDKGPEGTSIEGTVEDRTAHRLYETHFVLDREGKTTTAQCTCPKFRKAGLREGPCEHMIALRVQYGRESEERERQRATPEGRKLIRAETRIFVRRIQGEAETRRVSLDDRTVLVRSEPTGRKAKIVKLFFRKSEEAREEYFSRLEACGNEGFVDASAAEN